VPRNDQREAAPTPVWPSLHIPWSKSGSIRNLSLAGQLVDGLLGADLIGFHVPVPLQQLFWQTVDRTVIARGDGTLFSVLRQDHRTIVRPFPISVDFTR